jgi:hypothetical protein
VGELAVGGDGFFDGGQALLAAAQAGEADREGVQPFRAGLGLGVGGKGVEDTLGGDGGRRRQGYGG